MASAMLAGLRKKHPTLDCHIIEPFAPAREKLAVLGVTVHEVANRAEVDGADAVVLAVKPQVLKQVCAELLPCLNGELIVSIAAGTRGLNPTANLQIKFPVGIGQIGHQSLRGSADGDPPRAHKF